ncbi:hypothetical protein ACRCKS_19160 [Acinetobacter baumannii]|uniref:hypothetical protein n=1 Tax=Acinetobacter baumannii TaxID=470 RepID=UPI003D6C3091
MNQDYIAFDPTLSMNLNGREVQFLLNPLDEKYVEDPAIFAIIDKVSKPIKEKIT